jgi:hypothetical protein
MVNVLMGSSPFGVVTNVNQAMLPVCTPANTHGLFSYNTTGIWTWTTFFQSHMRTMRCEKRQHRQPPAPL